MWLDRETIAFVLLSLVFARLLWVDLRPLYRDWAARRQNRPIIVNKTIGCESRPLRPRAETPDFVVYANQYFVAIGNGRDTGETLNRVQARLFHCIGDPVLCPVKDSGAEWADIRDGEWAYFAIGRVVAGEIKGTVNLRDTTEEDKEMLTAYAHNIPLGDITYETRPSGTYYGLTMPTPKAWSFLLVVSADGVRAAHAEIKVECGDDGPSVTMVEVPYSSMTRTR